VFDLPGELRFLAGFLRILPVGLWSAGWEMWFGCGELLVGISCFPRAGDGKVGTRVARRPSEMRGFVSIRLRPGSE
jgi:hypothetical protein